MDVLWTYCEWVAALDVGQSYRTKRKTLVSIAQCLGKITRSVSTGHVLLFSYPYFIIITYTHKDTSRYDMQCYLL